MIIKEFPNTINDIQCAYIISKFGNFLTPSKLSYHVKDFRTSSSFKIPVSDIPFDLPLILSGLTSTSIDCQEPWELVKYSEHQVFKPHIDGKNRLISSLLYLNHPIEGGFTNFPKFGYLVKPEPGKLVYWYNTSNAVHESLPVIKGEKWVLVAWIKEWI